MMWWRTSAGSFARVIMPVISGYLEQWADGSPINLVVILLTFSYIAVLAMQKTLKQVTEDGSTTPTSTRPTPTSTTTTDVRTRLSQFRYLYLSRIYHIS